MGEVDGDNREDTIEESVPLVTSRTSSMVSLEKEEMVVEVEEVVVVAEVVDAEWFQDKNVLLHTNRNVLPPMSRAADQSQDNNVDLFQDQSQDNNAEVYQDSSVARFQNSSADLFQNKTAKVFQNSNVEMYQDNSAEMSQNKNE